MSKIKKSISPAYEEQITLYSPEYGDTSETIELNQITHELLQSNNWKEQQNLLRIYDNKFLNINKKQGKNIQSFTIHLTLLDPKAVRKLAIKFRYLFFSAILFGLSWLIYLLSQQDISFLDTPYMYSMMALPATAGAILLVYMIKQSKHVLIFYSQHGRAPIVELIYNNPRKQTFKFFMSEPVNCISAAQSKNYYNESQILAAELSEHRRLRDQKVLPNAEYEQAKTKIFKKHSQ